MADADRERWDVRYRGREPASLKPPSELLLTFLTEGPVPGLALDLACGSGRNALALAERGWRVDAVDVSPAGLALGRQAAEDRSIEGIRWLEADLDSAPPVTGPYDLILVIRYLNRALLAALPMLLAPGGRVLVELHRPAPSGQPNSGPRNPDFLITPEALRAQLASLVIEQLATDVVGDGDEPEFLTRLLARG